MEDEGTNAVQGARPRARRLLVVDDEPLVRELYAEALNGEGQVDVAADGIEALALLDANRYDLILTDVSMPRLDGLGLFETVLAGRPESAAAFMFVTGSLFGGNAVVIDGFSLPLLHKPIRMDALVAAVRGRLAEIAAARPTRARAHAPSAVL